MTRVALIALFSFSCVLPVARGVEPTMAESQHVCVLALAAHADFAGGYKVGERVVPDSTEWRAQRVTTNPQDELYVLGEGGVAKVYRVVPESGAPYLVRQYRGEGFREDYEKDLAAYRLFETLPRSPDRFLFPRVHEADDEALRIRLDDMRGFDADDVRGQLVRADRPAWEQLERVYRLRARNFVSDMQAIAPRHGILVIDAGTLVTLRGPSIGIVRIDGHINMLINTATLDMTLHDPH